MNPAVRNDSSTTALREREMRLFFDKKPVASFDDVLTLYKTAEFKSPTRSTVPLLSLLRHGG
jgi:hypothetical protein